MFIEDFNHFVERLDKPNAFDFIGSALSVRHQNTLDAITQPSNSIRVLVYGYGEV